MSNYHSGADDVSAATLCRLDSDLFELTSQLAGGVPDDSCRQAVRAVVDTYTMQNGPSSNHVFRDGWEESGSVDSSTGIAILCHLLNEYELNAFSDVYEALIEYITVRPTRRRIAQNRDRLERALADYLDLRGRDLSKLPALAADRRAAYGVNYSRDKWLYHHRAKMTLVALEKELENRAKSHSWTAIAQGGIRDALKRYSAFFSLPQPKHNAGRPGKS